MTTKLKVRIFNRISLKIYGYFSIMLLIFAIVLGTIFMKLYENSTMEFYKEQLYKSAKKIADVLQGYTAIKNITEDLREEYKDFLYMLEDIESNDVWIIRNKAVENPLGNDMENINLDREDLEKNVRVVIDRAMQGEFSYDVSFSDIYGMNMFTMGMPIYNSKNEVAGIILLNAFMQEQEKIYKSIQSLIIISGIMALFIAYIIVIIFVRKISLPIQKMKSTALELVEGNYEIKTNINLKDEVGELAKTIDILSERLMDNANRSESLEQMRRDFFANVSHELRTPITVIRAYTESLVDKVVIEEDKIDQYHERMLTECKTMERLVGDLLDLSKLQNADFKIEVEPISISQIFDDIIRSAKVIGNKKNVNIEVERKEVPFMIMGDYVRLRQMFMVILDNAIKFSNENSNVYIRIRVIKDKLKISIKDNGIGISKEELPFIFEKFYKSKSRQNATGSGLGLAIANQIAIRHGGKITVKSVINKGCEFIFEFDYLEWDEDEEFYPMS